MQRIIHTTLLALFLLATRQQPMAQCSPSSMYLSHCNNSDALVTFPGIDQNQVLFQVRDGDAAPGIKLGQYQGSGDTLKARILSNWNTGGTMYFAFSGTELVATQDISLLETGEYSLPGSHQVVLYGMAPGMSPAFTLITFFNQADTTPGTILTTTAGYPGAGSSSSFTQFNDMLQIPNKHIFSIKWEGSGSNNCQDYAYRFIVTY